MRNPLIIVLVILPVILCSCGKRKEIKEEKITITVERPDKGASEPREFREHMQAEDMVPERSQANRINLEESREILREMIENDPRIIELAKEKNVSELTRYLLDNHKNEVNKIAEISNIENERLAAFQLSRQLIRREKFRQYPKRRHQDFASPSQATP